MLDFRQALRSKTMSRLIFVKSIPRETATGIHNWTSQTSGLKLQKTKVGRAGDGIIALYSAKVGGLANYISYNYKIDPKTGQPELDEAGNKITLQAYLEKKWNKPAGFFSNQAASPRYRGDGSDLGFYYQHSWELKDGSTVFDLDKMEHEIGYYVLLASSKVANSETEWRQHKWPKATHYIALENESEEIKYKRSQMKSKAFALLHSADFTEAVKKKVVCLLGISPARTKLSEEQTHNLLTEWIDSSTYISGSNIDKINNLATLLKTADGRAQFEIMFMLKQAEDFRIVFQKQDVWSWIRPNGSTIVIGDKYSEAIDFFLNPKKKEEFDEIRQQIKDKA